ncbi:MAG: peroxide stress protein YaaA [Saprospiraceae bacterium]|nr:peroxide stress protein YaaA [Saprospiraceae bacterium]
MILLLSPSKTLDFSEPEYRQTSGPRLLAESEKLVDILDDKSVPELRELMDISRDLAKLNRDRFEAFETPFSLENAKQAILAFKGDVYTGFEVESLEADDLSYAQDHLRILSGLYGLLRPLDLMQPYRLEMGTRLENDRGDNLYEFWGDRITRLINEDLQALDSKAVINLASREYFRSVNTEHLKGDIYDIDFKDKRNDKYRIIAVYAKKARGRMARFAVENRLTKPGQLKDFKWEGYAFNPSLSEDRHLVFTR